MTHHHDDGTVAYCGLICSACEAMLKGCAGCHQGGGEPCEVRDCCLTKGLQGCWECDAFPCTRGPFGNEEWAGLCIGLVQAIQKQTLQRLVEHVRARLGEVIDYGAFRGLSADEVMALIDPEA